MWGGRFSEWALSEIQNTNALWHAQWRKILLSPSTLHAWVLLKTKLKIVMHLLNIILFLFYAFFVDLGIKYSMFTFNFDLYSPSIDNGNIYCNFYFILFSFSYIAIKQGLEFLIIGYKFMRYNLCIFIFRQTTIISFENTIFKIFEETNALDNHRKFTIYFITCEVPKLSMPFSF